MKNKHLSRLYEQQSLLTKIIPVLIFLKTCFSNTTPLAEFLIHLPIHQDCLPV